MKVDTYKFRVGTEIRMRYMGVYDWEMVREGPNSGIDREPGKIVGVRLEAELEENEDGMLELTYPKGWEYLIARVNRRKGVDESSLDGWTRESELLKHGYTPNNM